MEQVLHYPRLDTVLRVENLLREAGEPLSKNEIDRRLKKKIMRPTLNVILRYLEQSGKAALLTEGVLWIYAEDISEKLKKKLEQGVNANESTIQQGSARRVRTAPKKYRTRASNKRATSQIN